MFPFVVICVCCVYIDGLAVKVKKVVDDNYPFRYVCGDYDIKYLADDWNCYDVVFVQVRAKKWNGKKNVQVDSEVFYPREKWIREIKKDWIK